MESLASTTAGLVRGPRRDGVHIFKGIPYGQSARFRPPAPAAPWAGERAATAYGPSCPQLYLDPEDITEPRLALSALFGIPLLEPEAQDEDCLFLNVWTPGLADGGRRPVLVRLHGRGFHGGSGSWAWADGERLARRGDAVVITVNHRLGVLGHLALDGLGGAANAGILDLVLALRWVSENAASFGGDPGNVTIFGESGGGAKVATLLHVPAARGLFHRAIVQSGAGFAPTPWGRATELAGALADVLGVSLTAPEALTALPVQEILEAQLEVGRQLGGGSAAFRVTPYRPVLDGEVVTDEPATGVPLLIGTSRHEQTMFLAVEGLGRAAGFSVDEAQLRERLAPALGAGLEDVLSAYRAQAPGLSATELLVLVSTDSMFRLPSLGVAEDHVAPAFVYLVEWRSPGLNGFLGATHAICVPFTMDTRAVVPMADGPGAAELTEIMSETWLTFARSGDPGNPRLPDWPAYDEDRRSTMIFDVPPRLAEDPHGGQRQALANPPAARART